MQLQKNVSSRSLQVVHVFVVLLRMVLADILLIFACQLLFLLNLLLFSRLLLFECFHHAFLPALGYARSQAILDS